MKKIKVMAIFGTRPEAIKMAPVVQALKFQKNQFESIVVVTAQHREMLDQVLDAFHIVPDYDLNIMKKNQTLSMITASVLVGLDPIIEETQPDVILVHGDTTTAFAASISAFYHHVKICHVEAGLRTGNLQSPFPEEMNRQVTDVLSDFYFAPTEQSRKNLIKENHPAKQIFVTGNTAIDALKSTVKTDYQHPILTQIPSSHRILLMTMHRRENLGAPMEEVFKAVQKIADTFEDVEVVFPVHLNPIVRDLVNEFLENHPRIHLIEPLDVIDFHNISARSYLILSDSGGVQEEAPSLGVPVLVLRDSTERPEGVDAGTLKLVGTKTQDVFLAVSELLENPQKYQEMSRTKNPYGDGNASQRILEIIANSASFN
ncbi:UDP-N-acetylglucosamine 2-epimerase (non-hydrolyzing) [Enterococcus rotai]|uniref:UDP-N-acetylglucosamine 2-epimerase (non-hydrolyzing) n=1 Tax=Enterococcus rotai TaxID=118060 RepID=A0A0U2X503_9ENTE|nr:UDP-N-acetylglucosamine 2-epimerase (non-hydrolyzing) [Enterococcus rotai]ALS35879.1 UDP-N-acetyl glucosamine 2-epimerase [Enterococcus rotai]